MQVGDVWVEQVIQVLCGLLYVKLGPSNG